MPSRGSSPAPLRRALRPPRRIGTTIMIAVACVTPAAADAQLRAEGAIGGARVTQATHPARAAATLQGGAEYAHRALVLHGTGSVTRPTDGDDPRLHGGIGGVLRTPLGRFVGELGVAGSLYDDGVFPVARSTRVTALVRGRAASFAWWAGAGSGGLDDGVNTYPLALAELGVARSAGPVHLAMQATRHATRAEPRTEVSDDPEPIDIVVRDRIAYTDAVVAPRFARGALAVEGRAGIRVVHRTIAFEPRTHRPFGNVDVAWTLTPRLALAAGIGHDLADLARGLPQVRYATLMLRVRTPTPTRARRVGAVHPSRGTVAAPEVLVERPAPPGTLLRVLTGGDVRRVEIAATFTAWEPVALTRERDGVWLLAAELASGPHRIMVRVDDGEWAPPRNLPALTDEELGGRVGLITVP